MKAKFLYEQNETNHHIENMVKEALSYAIKEQIRLPFWFERAFIRQLLQQEKDGILAGLSQKEWDFICDTLDRGKKSSQSELLKQMDKRENENTQLQKNIPGTELTDREIEVLHEIADGNTNKEIANHLCISIATVKTHLINIYSKLGVNNRVAAVNQFKNNIIQ